MESRTNFYGPVWAMLALSGVAITGFISPAPTQNEIDRQTEEVRTPSDTDNSAEQQVLPPLDNASEVVSDSEAPSKSDSPTNLLESSEETIEPSGLEANTGSSEPEPVSFIDWLFTPIPQQPTAPSP